MFPVLARVCLLTVALLGQSMPTEAFPRLARPAVGAHGVELVQCRPGSDWDGNRCVRRYGTCPRGSDWNGYRCVERYGACPRGWDWNGRRCVRRY
jgi:hypothetical protein